MKKILSVVLILSMIFAVAACGGKGPDVTGRYICTSSVDMFQETNAGVGEYLVLSAGGKGIMGLSDDGTDGSETTWKVKGEKLTLTSLIFNFEGTIKDDVIVIEIMLTTYTFAKEGSEALKTLQNAAPPAKADDNEDDDGIVGGDSGANADMLGRYDCTGWDMGSGKLPPAGEWLELETDTRGTVCIAGKEYPFDWTFDGTTLTIKEDVGVTYTAAFEDGVITLDTGMLYIFEKGGAPAAQPDEEVPEIPLDDESAPTGFMSPTTEITIPSLWYGILWSDELDYEGDVYAVFEYDGDYPYLDIYEDPELAEAGYDPILSMYIFEDADMVLPDIGEDDAWFFDRTLTSDDEDEFTAYLFNGSLYFEGVGEYDGESFTAYIFLRENGAPWDEEYDPLPPDYELYKDGF